MSSRTESAKAQRKRHAEELKVARQDFYSDGHEHAMQLQQR